MLSIYGEKNLGLLKPLSLRQKVVVISGRDKEEGQPRVRNLGAVAYVQKPINTRRLLLGLLYNGPSSDGEAESPSGFAASVGRFVFDEKSPGRGKQVASFEILAILAWILHQIVKNTGLTKWVGPVSVGEG